MPDVYHRSCERGAAAAVYPRDVEGKNERNTRNRSTGRRLAPNVRAIESIVDEVGSEGQLRFDDTRRHRRARFRCRSFSWNTGGFRLSAALASDENGASSESEKTNDLATIQNAADWQIVIIHPQLRKGTAERRKSRAVRGPSLSRRERASSLRAPMACSVER